MSEFDVIIVGAGAAGLVASSELCGKGKSIAILEARNRIGGRIHTFSDSIFSQPVETGAEFIHGQLLLTKSLLKRAHIKMIKATGNSYEIREGKVQGQDIFDSDFPLLISRLNKLKRDISLAGFLDKYFPGLEFASLRASTIRYAEGYDAADINRVSAFSLRDEWSGENDSDQFRPAGGYIRLINFLMKKSSSADCNIFFSAVVKEVRWKPYKVDIICSDGRHFTAEKIIISIPLGVLQSEAQNPGNIQFIPEISEQRRAFGAMGFGKAIKVILEFNSRFWENEHNRRHKVRLLPKAMFVFSDASLPTWWTQLPHKSSVLTGWLAGPKALKLCYAYNQEIIDVALTSLAYIFDTSKEFVKDQLKAAHVANWCADPFTLGAYAYTTVESGKTLRLLNRSVKHTIFFAGEAFYRGPATGTVEAALESGKLAAQNVLHAL